MPSQPSPDPVLAPLFYADTRRSSDLLYFGGIEIHDPFIAFQWQKKRWAVVSQLEYGRVLKNSSFRKVLLLEEWQKRARSEFGASGPAEIIRALARSLFIPGFRIPEDFPAGLAFALREAGVVVLPEGLPFFSQRIVKSANEAALIRRANEVCSAAFSEVESALRRSRPKDGILHLGGQPLTSERVHEIIARVCFSHGAQPNDPIVAGGDQACDPHCRGSGALRAGTLIIVDIFPRLMPGGYHGDMTRTYLKWRASEPQKALVSAVRSAHAQALANTRAGVDGSTLYRATCEWFEFSGYQTQRRHGIPEGFFHSLGHGLGLDVHEPPRLSVASQVLRAGHVVTIEPGLYYPGLGGCRIEDVVWVRRSKADLLSSHGYDWEIR